MRNVKMVIATRVRCLVTFRDKKRFRETRAPSCNSFFEELLDFRGYWSFNLVYARVIEVKTLILSKINRGNQKHVQILKYFELNYWI